MCKKDKSKKGEENNAPAENQTVQPDDAAECVKVEEAGNAEAAEEENQPDGGSPKDEEGLQEPAAGDEADQVAQLTAKVAESEDRYRRVYAEFENFRKRTATEKAELIINGGKDVIKSILPVIDDLERALQSMADDDADKEGVKLIYNKMMSILQQKGLKAMEAKGTKFDEKVHEAVTTIPATSEEQKNVVFDVVEKGYFLNDKVLRYAKVVVSM